MMESIPRFRLTALCAGVLSISAPAFAQLTPADFDADGYEDLVDSCPLIFDPEQEVSCEEDLALDLLRDSSGEAELSTTPLVLYDVDFGTPPHTIGEPPVLVVGPAPRDVPTGFLGQAPIVVAALGSMDEQPLRFGSGVYPFDQVRFGIGHRFGDNGFRFQLPRYHFELTVMIVRASQEVVVFFDGPSAWGVLFHADGRINARTGGAGAYDLTIARWDPGVPRRLIVDIDRSAEEWMIALDGEEVFSGPYPILLPFGMRSLRVSAQVGSIAAIDDVLVTDRPLVDVDIRPGSDVNPVNPMSRGLIPVAILGSGLFDVDDVDRSTLAFGPDGASAAHRAGGHPQDVNGDGRTDLVTHYENQETGIAFGDTQACVAGRTYDGTPFGGCDDIATPPKGCGGGFQPALVLPPVIAARRRRRRIC